MESGYRKNSGKWFWAVFAVAIGLASLPLLPLCLEPAYGGRKVSEWFEQAVQESYSPNYPDGESESYRAFREMEGRAVPYLTRWIKAQPSWFDRSYAVLTEIFPARVKQALPQPRVSFAYCQVRRFRALELLGRIGAMQQFKSEAGEPVVGTRAATAVPILCAQLTNGDRNIRALAVQTLGSIGPPAAPAVPWLIELVQNSNDATAAYSLGRIGPAASNAVEVLESMASSRRSDRIAAVQSLGWLGPAARRATPTLVALLGDSDEKVSQQAARSLAEIGETPNEAVTALIQMKQSTNDGTRLPATLALWNRNRNDRELIEAITNALQSEKRVAVASMLGQLGTNAQRFAPEIRKLLQDPDPILRRNAARVLRKVESVQP